MLKASVLYSVRPIQK